MGQNCHLKAVPQPLCSFKRNETETYKGDPRGRLLEQPYDGRVLQREDKQVSDELGTETTVHSN